MVNPYVGGELGAANFEDLHELYFTRTGAPDAMLEFNRIRNGASRRRLHSLLRHHACRAVRDQSELRLRDAFDDLLSYYGLLEIACSLGYVAFPNEEVLSKATRVLQDEDVRTFYEEHYPILLPQLFLRRASGLRSYVVPVEQVSIMGLHRFLDLNATLEDSIEAAAFMGMLDDYVLGDEQRPYDFEDLLDVVARPILFVQRMSRPEQERDDLDRALHGFRIFIRFCAGLDALLQELESSPVQQSLLWHHHAYWFECIRYKAGSRLHAALDSLDAWDDSPFTGHERELAEPVAYAGSMHEVIGRLTSGRYGWALRESPNHPQSREAAHAGGKFAT
jgi:hypothetical protein